MPLYVITWIKYSGFKIFCFGIYIVFYDLADCLQRLSRFSEANIAVRAVLTFFNFFTLTIVLQGGVDLILHRMGVSLVLHRKHHPWNFGRCQGGVFNFSHRSNHLWAVVSFYVYNITDFRNLFKPIYAHIF